MVVSPKTKPFAPENVVEIVELKKFFFFVQISN